MTRTHLQFSTESAIREEGAFVLRTGKLFECDKTFRDMNGKEFTLTSAQAADSLPNFKPVPIKLQHMPTLFDSPDFFTTRPEVRRLWLDGKNVMAEYAIPKWFHEASEGKPVPFSAEIDTVTGEFIGADMVLKGAVADAVMMAAFAEFRSGEDPLAKHHDMAVQHGAECGGKSLFAESAKFLSPAELKAVQKIHDNCKGEGDKNCDALQTRNKMYYSESIDPRASLRPEKESAKMSLTDRIKALFQRAGVPDEKVSTKEIEAAVAAETSDKEVTPLVGFSELKSASFAESAEYKAQAALIASQQEAISAMQANFAASTSAAQFAANQDEIKTLCRQDKMTAGEAVEWTRIAKETPAAFAAALPALKSRTALAQFATPTNTRHIKGAAGTPGADLVTLTKERMKATGEKYIAAFSAVCAENPDLAGAHKANVNSASKGE